MMQSASQKKRTGVLLSTVIKFKLFLIQWIVSCHLSFLTVENIYFRNLLSCLNEKLADFLPKAGGTIRAWVMEEFYWRHLQLKQDLHNGRSRVHLSFDLWTSSNSMAMLAVVAHFIDEHYINRTIFLGLRRVQRSHSGENMAQQVITVINDFELVDLFGYFVLDNAESNDTCVEAILKELCPEMTGNRRHQRLQCIGHIINLAAQALLFGDDPEAFSVEARVLKDMRSETRELNLWRKKGAFGKLHNIVTHICQTPQRREFFLGLSSVPSDDWGNLMVKQDNATRWNSACDMIKRALQLKDPIDFYTLRHVNKSRDSNEHLHKDTLTPQDWIRLTELYDLLEPFQTQTARLEGHAKEGHHGSAWEILPTIEMLITKLEHKQSSFRSSTIGLPYHRAATEEDYITEACRMSILKLKKYQKLLWETPAYAAALVIHPGKK